MLSRATAAAIVALAPAWGAARAADEIQVYNAEINSPGQFSLQLHGNYIARGSAEPEFPGGLVPDGSFNGTPEFAWGMTDWWEVGAYLPYAVLPGEGFLFGGAKLRTLFVSPHAAERRFFYGANIEVGWATERFAENRWNAEVRPIIGWRWKPIELVFNPILDVPLSGDHRAVVLAPAARLGLILSPAWTVALEHYADLGPIGDLAPLDDQAHELYAVVDYGRAKFDVDAGIGRGLTDASNDWTAKFILSWGF